MAECVVAGRPLADTGEMDPRSERPQLSIGAGWVVTLRETDHRSSHRCPVSANPPRMRSPPRRNGEGNDPSRSRRQIVVLLNPVISMTSGSLTTRPPPGGDTERRRPTPGFLLVWVGVLIRIPSLPRNAPALVPALQSVVPHPIRNGQGFGFITEHTQDDPEPGRASTPLRSRSYATGRASTPQRSRIRSRIPVTWAFSGSSMGPEVLIVPAGVGGEAPVCRPVVVGAICPCPPATEG